MLQSIVWDNVSKRFGLIESLPLTSPRPTTQSLASFLSGKELLGLIPSRYPNKRSIQAVIQPSSLKTLKLVVEHKEFGFFRQVT